MGTHAEMKRHMAYSEWASSRLLKAALALPAAEVRQDFRTADKSILGTLVHIMAADRIWLRRVQGAAPGPFVEDSDFGLEALAGRWPEIWSGWQSASGRRRRRSRGRLFGHEGAPVFEPAGRYRSPRREPCHAPPGTSRGFSANARAPSARHRPDCDAAGVGLEPALGRQTFIAPSTSTGDS